MGQILLRCMRRRGVPATEHGSMCACTLLCTPSAGLTQDEERFRQALYKLRDEAHKIEGEGQRG